MVGTKTVIRNNLDDETASLQYFIELIELNEGIIVIRGWVYSKEKCPVEVQLVDDKKIHIKKSQVWRKSRRDVRKIFELDDDYKSEFVISFDRKDISDDLTYIHFCDDSKNEMYIRLDMHKLDSSFTAWGKFTEFITDSPIKRTARYLKNHGVLGAFDAFKEQKDAYTVWREANMPSAHELEVQRTKKFDYNPLISISIPLYNTPIEFFEPLMQSIMNQTYGNFQLCLADGSDNDNIEKYIKESYSKDNRINYIHLDKNLGIAGNTNKALEMASGEYVMLTDHDDLLEINALFEIVKVLNDDSSIDIIYTDEDLVDASGHIFSDYRFKPDFNLEMLRHINYICHIFFVRKSIMDHVGGFREEYDGAQDFDMILRCVELTDKIYHIPKILYHWRAHDDSTAGNVDSKQYAVDASVRALKQHYKRVGIEADVEATDIFIMLKSTRKLLKRPLVSIIIPNMDHIDDLDKCLQSIINKTNYDNYEVIIVENNSTKEDTFKYYEKISEKYDFVKICTWEDEFNYSKINNFGVKYAKGEYYILLNNDIEVRSPDWIDRMVAYLQYNDIGAVGAKLLYPDDTVQHCGIVIGVGGFAGHIMTESDIKDSGYFGKLRVQQEVSAATAACLGVDASVYKAVGGFDEEFAVALNDVDLCLKIRDMGKKIVLDPNISMYHYESKSRGYEESSEQISRFKREIKLFREKWSNILEEGDPYYSPNLTLDRADCSPRRMEERFLIIEEIERGDI